MNDEDIIKAAVARMAEAVSFDLDNREEALDDMEHLAGRQWPDDVKQAREADGRPVITINRLPQFVRQVTGDIRRLNPAIKVIPGDNKATEETAEIYGGLIRAIENASDASSVYESAAEQAAMCGMGAFRVLAEYYDDASFDQELCIKRIHNPFAVYWDPAARESTREDARFCFITDQMKKDDFEEAYPGKEAADTDTDGMTDGMEHWHDGGSVVVAEYFWKEPVTKTIGLLADGTIIEDPKAIHNTVRTRDVESHKVMWAKISGRDVLEGPTEIPGKHIPVVSVVGEEIHVGDEVVRSSVIRHAKDPQRLYNYWTSTHTEMVALQPKAPYLVTPKQIAKLETIWAEANDKNRAYLPYNPDEKAPPPARQPPPMPSAGMVQEAMKAAEDMKATTGIYDSGLGQQSNETSGVAIRQRQLESDIATSIYTDNLAKAIAQCGRILVGQIPSIYDTARIVRIIGDDEQEQMVPVNGQAFDPMQGVVQINPLTVGTYDVRVTVGPNYTTRRQETAESMMQFVQAFPQAGVVAGDLIAKAMDWPDADKLAERLAKTLPPGMIAQDQMPPEQQQQMAQARQQQQAAQQQQQQAADMAMQLDMKERQAKAAQAEQSARKAGFDAERARADLDRARTDAQSAELAFNKARFEARTQAMMPQTPMVAQQ